MGMKETLTALISQNQPDVLLPSKEAIAQKAEPDIQKIVEDMKKNVDGAWFSFGDTRLMRQALDAMARDDHGRDILKKLGGAVPISSERGLSAYGSWHTTHKNVTLNSDFLQSAESNYTSINGVDGENYITLQHELLHAVQDKYGIKSGFGMTFEQSATVQKLIEAETQAWDETTALTFSAIDCEFGDHASKDVFMKRDLKKKLKRL